MRTRYLTGALAVVLVAVLLLGLWIAEAKRRSWELASNAEMSVGGAIAVPVPTGWKTIVNKADDDQHAIGFSGKTITFGGKAELYVIVRRRPSFLPDVHATESLPGMLKTIGGASAYQPIDAGMLNKPRLEGPIGDCEFAASWIYLKQGYSERLLGMGSCLLTDGTVVDIAAVGPLDSPDLLRHWLETFSQRIRLLEPEDRVRHEAATELDLGGWTVKLDMPVFAEREDKINATTIVPAGEHVGRLWRLRARPVYVAKFRRAEALVRGHLLDVSSVNQPVTVESFPAANGLKGFVGDRPETFDFLDLRLQETVSTYLLVDRQGNGLLVSLRCQSPKTNMSKLKAALAAAIPPDHPSVPELVSPQNVLSGIDLTQAAGNVSGWYIARLDGEICGFQYVLVEQGPSVLSESSLNGRVFEYIDLPGLKYHRSDETTIVSDLSQGQSSLQIKFEGPLQPVLKTMTQEVDFDAASVRLTTRINDQAPVLLETRRPAEFVCGFLDLMVISAGATGRGGADRLPASFAMALPDELQSAMGTVTVTALPEEGEERRFNMVGDTSFDPVMVSFDNQGRWLKQGYDWGLTLTRSTKEEVHLRFPHKAVIAEDWVTKQEHNDNE